MRLVPDYAVLFVQLILMFALSESISQPLITAMLATGNIKKYQIVVGGMQLMNLPVSYILLRLGYPPQSVIITAIVISQLCLIARLILLRKMIGISFMHFMRKVYFNVILVTLLSIVVPLVIQLKVSECFASFIMLTIISVCCTALAIIYVGCNKKERKIVKKQLYKFKQKIA